MNKPKHLGKYIVGTVMGVFALRTLKLAYQRSRLEQWIENIFGGQERTVSVDQSLIDTLPKTSLSFSGRPSEPINLLIIGTRPQIEAAFRRVGWVEAVPISASNWVKAFWAGVRNKSYPDGPMTPFYIATTPNDLSFQCETDRHSFRERHHLRLWETNLRAEAGLGVWLATASFDRSLRLFHGAKMPFHHIDPDLDAERDLIAEGLVKIGAREVGRFHMTEKLKGRNIYHDRYFTDGQIVALDLSRVKDEAADS